jgi:Protein of unknown function (DUF1826)
MSSIHVVIAIFIWKLITSTSHGLVVLHRYVEYQTGPGKARRTERAEMQSARENLSRAHACDSNCGTCDSKATKKKKTRKDTPVALVVPSISSIVVVDKPYRVDEIILREEVQLVVWRRSEVPKFATTLADPMLDLSALPHFVGLVTPATAAERIRNRLVKSEPALPSDDITGLANDVEQLVMVFAKLVETDQVHVRLECVEDNGCCYWHQDSVPFRLVTTYRGPCTQYVHPDLSHQTLLRRQHDSEHAQSLTLRDVAFFKGRLFADSDSDDDREEDIASTSSDDDDLLNQPGIVHRSPRIEGSGVVRVVLVLDIPAAFHDDDDDEEEVEEKSENTSEGLDTFTLLPKAEKDDWKL